MGKPATTQKLYRLRHIKCTDLYVAERMGGWARWDKQAEAMTVWIIYAICATFSMALVPLGRHYAQKPVRPFEE